jgi:hypothetical protein
MRFLTIAFVFAISCLMFASFGQAAPIEGLVLYFTFDEEGDTVEDLSGQGNDGVVKGDPKWVKGKTGLALEFSGAENRNYVEVADNPSLNPAKEVSCAAWIYSDGFEPTGGIISKYIGAGNQRSYNLQMNNDAAAIGSFMSYCSSNGACQVGISTTNAITPAGSLAEGEWNHVAMTFKAKEFLRLYINGELIVETNAAATDSLFDNNTPLLIGTDFQIGGAHSGQPREFTGIIDEPMVFNRVLSEAEIKDIMDGISMSVESSGKLAITWGAIKKP